MGTRIARWLVAGLLLAWSAAAPAAPAATEEPPPDELQSLHLTDLQRRILEEAFHRQAFEAPPLPKLEAVFGVKVEPVAPGGLYRLGAEGDLPPRLVVTVGSLAGPASIRLIYFVQDFYGRKVAAGALPPVFPDRAGLATADLVLKEVTAFGYYHVLVTATQEQETVTGACGIAVVHPREAVADPKSPFGLAAPPGKIPPLLPEICRRLGVRHLALDGVANDELMADLQKAGLVPTAILRSDFFPDGPAPEVFADTMSEVVQRHAETIRDWQFGRRPVFVEASLADAVAAYRQAMTGLVTAVRQRQAPATLWVSASPDVMADVLTEGPVLAGVDGVSLCVDAGAEWPNLRSGAYRRSLDYGLQMARRAGVKQAVVGETGDDPAFASPQQQAWKLVTRHVLSLAAGVQRVYVTYGRGLPTPVASAAAYAWMTHLLDGAAYEGAAWDEVPLLEAHLWSGPERRVAVVWSWIGEDAANPDHGALVFDNGSGLEAMDVVGRPVGIWKGPRLVVPLGEAPVYLVSGELKAGELRDRIRGARILGLPPAGIHVENIIRGEAPGKVNVTLRVQSHRPHRIGGQVGLLLPDGWKARQAKQTFGIDPGEAREVTFECDVSAEAAPAPYPIEAVASFDEEYVRHAQVVWPAQAPQRTIEVGYGLADWEGIEPVVLRNESGSVQAQVRTAWDANYFYFSAAVQRPRAGFRGGRFDSQGDAIQLAWGLADRADDDFGHRSRGLAMPSGAFRDTDHLMALTFGKDGAQVVRLRGPRIVLRDRVPGNLDPWYGPVEGAAADISRDEAAGLTIYEAAIPFKALAPLRGERGRIFRFGFRIGDAGHPPLEWSRAAGVPDFLAGPSSYLPTAFADGLPCQTWWGMVGPKAAEKQ